MTISIAAEAPLRISDLAQIIWTYRRHMAQRHPADIDCPLVLYLDIARYNQLRGTMPTDEEASLMNELLCDGSVCGVDIYPVLSESMHLQIYEG